MAVTDDERRRVAAALREYASFDCEDEGEEECLVDCADWGERVLNLLGCGDTEGECYAALADLIEPSIPADPGEAGLACVDAFIREMRHSTKEEQDEYGAMLEKMSVELHPVDRDALLKLADEMEIDGAGALDDGDWCKPLLVEYARRIREALGVTDHADA